MVKTDFLISPAYQVPQIATTRSVKFTRMAQSDAVPSSAGIGLEARQVAGW